MSQPRSEPATERNTQAHVSLSVIVFAYNEAQNVGPVLRELLAWLAEHEPLAEVVFIDDGSSDASFDVAKQALEGTRCQLLRHERNRGIGAALKSAVKVCSGQWVTFLPADGQIEPAAIGTLRAAAARGDVDMVFSNYDHRGDGAYRAVLSFSLRALIFAVHGVLLRCEGPYLFRRELMVPEQLPPDTFFLNFEFPIRMLAAGKRVREVMIKCRPRRSGVSKSSSLRRIVGVAEDLVDLRVRRLREAVRR